MNGLPYFAFYANDFVGGVKLFTTEEIGAYMLLLCYQWTNGPLPKEQADLDRIACATVSQRVRNKFQDTEHGLVNTRLEVERVRGMTKKKNAMDRLHRHRKNKKSETRFNGVAKPVAQRFPSDSDSNSSKMSNGAPDSQEVKQGANIHGTKKRKTKAEIMAEYTPDFLAICEAYPNIPSRKDAFAAWQATVNRPPVEEVLAKIKEHKASDQWTKDGGRFIPGLTVWINQRRWEAKMLPAVAASSQPGGMNSERKFDRAKHDAYTARRCAELGIGVDDES